jgi:hypothetical protein
VALAGVTKHPDAVWMERATIKGKATFCCSPARARQNALLR